MSERLIYAKGKCPCCHKEISGWIADDTKHFPCPICKGIIPRVFCNTSEYSPDASDTKRIDVPNN